MRLQVWLLVLWVSLFPALAGAAANEAAANDKQKSNEPIHVIADRLEVDNVKQMANFIGAVKAVQGDVTIVCDNLEVYYERNQAADEQNGAADALVDDGGQVHTVVALGHVKITQQERVAVGRKATYWAGSRTILLEGQATAWKGSNQVSGEQITLYLDENQSIVESRPGRRVTVTMYPEQQNNQGARTGPDGVNQPAAIRPEQQNNRGVK